MIKCTAGGSKVRAHIIYLEKIDRGLLFWDRIPRKVIEGDYEFESNKLSSMGSLNNHTKILIPTNEPLSRNVCRIHNQPIGELCRIIENANREVASVDQILKVDEEDQDAWFFENSKISIMIIHWGHTNAFVVPKCKEDFSEKVSLEHEGSWNLTAKNYCIPAFAMHNIYTTNKPTLHRTNDTNKRYLEESYVNAVSGLNQIFGQGE